MNADIFNDLISFLGLAFSPLAFLIVGFHSGRESLAKGGKAAIVKGFQVWLIIFGLLTVFILVLISLLILFGVS